MNRSNLRKAVLAATAITLSATAQQPGRLEFEAVSIKPGDPAAHGRMAQRTGGGFRGTNLRLFELIMGAWGVNPDQLLKGQAMAGLSWVDTAGWDVDARLPAGASPAMIPEMMRAMLAERFQLVVHRETRSLPVYALAAAKGGIKLPEGDGKGGQSAGPRRIHYNSGTMSDLAGQLSGYVGRHVIDQTGAAGQYAINLSFAPVDLDASPDAPAQDSAPSIFQALQEQAGLKLESAKGPVEVLVIDHAEKPSPN